MKNLIIVTGGAGFVGSNLIELLLKKTKYQIISLDNYSSGLKKNHIKNKRVNYLKGHTSEIKKILDKYKKVTYKKNVLDLIKNSDLVIIHTEWNEFKQLNFKKMIKKRTNIYDLRNLYSPTEMKKNKINYFGIGR